MIEIAIAVGVIGFALVAIIGILPRGMNVQKDNREETIISQDAPYFLNAIRNGEMRTNNNILTSFVESITITNIFNGTTNINVYDNQFLGGTSNIVLTNDMAIIGYLTMPEMDTLRMPGQTNEVSAIVRAMSGSAVQQNGANSAMAFRYQLSVEVVPWNFVPPGYTTTYAAYNPYSGDAPPTPGQQAAMNYLGESLHEIRLRFAWPVLPNGTVGPNRQTYRSFISAHMTNLNANGGWWFFQPQSYSSNTNS